jgi:PAS domain S-box-containing protein
VYSDAANLSHKREQCEKTHAENPFQAAIDAAEMGTWSWDIPSGRLDWTPRTWQLFGFEPGAFATSYDSFMKMVYADDRPAVLRWCEHAVRERSRTAIEFRIVRGDGAVRWVRSTGRAMSDEGGQAVRMVGVVDDITGDRQGQAEPQAAPGQPAGKSFSLRQVAHILGIAEVTVKRIATAGGIEFLRSSRKNSRRFAPEQVLEYLRKNTAAGGDFDSAARAQDMSGCLAVVLKRLLDGNRLEDLLDDLIRPAVRAMDAVFMAQLLSRLPFIECERQRAAFPVLVAGAGSVDEWDAGFVGCLLRAHGREVLSPADNVGVTKLADIAERIRARMVVLLIGGGAHSAEALSVAADIARTPHPPAVCVWSSADVRPAAGVLRIRSMRDLGSVLRGL